MDSQKIDAKHDTDSIKKCSAPIQKVPSRKNSIVSNQVAFQIEKRQLP